MLKKIGLPLLTLAAILVFVPAPQAKAGVRFGAYVGGPAYVAPPPVYRYQYPAPVYDNGYAYPYAAPAYVYPNNTWRGHEYGEHRNYESRGRESHDYRGSRGRR